MKTFNYKPKNDLQNMFKNYWPILLAAVLAIWAVASPSGIRLFRVIRIPFPISTILIVLVCAAVLVYMFAVKMPRIQRDAKLSKPIAVDNGVVTCTVTKTNPPKEISFKASEANVYFVDDDDDEFAVKAGANEEDITFYKNYFDSESEYSEFKKLFNMPKEQ